MPDLVSGQYYLLDMTSDHNSDINSLVAKWLVWFDFLKELVGLNIANFFFFAMLITQICIDIASTLKTICHTILKLSPQDVEHFQSLKNRQADLSAPNEFCIPPPETFPNQQMC